MRWLIVALFTVFGLGNFSVLAQSCRAEGDQCSARCMALSDQRVMDDTRCGSGTCEGPVPYGASDRESCLIACGVGQAYCETETQFTEQEKRQYELLQSKWFREGTDLRRRDEATARGYSENRSSQDIYLDVRNIYCPANDQLGSVRCGTEERCKAMERIEQCCRWSYDASSLVDDIGRPYPDSMLPGVVASKCSVEGLETLFGKAGLR